MPTTLSENAKPLVLISPFSLQLGLCYGMVDYVRGKYVLPPFDHDGNFLKSTIGIVEIDGPLGQNKTMYLGIMGENSRPEELSPFWAELDCVGNLGSALIKMSNIAFDALIARQDEDAAITVGATKFWEVQFRDYRKNVRRLFATFPDVNGTETRASSLEGIMGHRDYAHKQLMSSMFGIMDSNVDDAVKR